MSREILLKSWNEENKQFYYFIDGLYFSQQMYNEYSRDGVTSYTDGEMEENEACFDWNNSKQFTGLTDKNNVKIFEGDNVKCWLCYTNKHMTDVVSFKNNGWYPFNSKFPIENKTYSDYPDRFEAIPPTIPEINRLKI
jgi:uncharacterized phage protein (TIGR01671 family)